ncbi:DegT/DnrJ/EryC1/StrS family aminotransferase [Streptomyces sp. NPDC127084]|uniref:DegT/DnrJ/EryC1/StrS family aminotransferase n=1 Tax=Streptomyces sp. NPDC127084 TaxID=3347133 RepID=UPI003656FEB4
MRDRTGRESLYVPSCRFGLYLALRHWCRPGGRVLMSPVNDDVIFFVVLAAGLRPVQAPLNARHGSIDPAAVPDALWQKLSAVLTTNLYGNPDPAPALRARCDALGIPLIEDAAHAIGSRVPGGRAVGDYGDASVFSLSKHTGAKTGGFLTVADPARRAALEEARDDLLLPSRAGSELAYALRPYAEAGVRGLRLARAARAVPRLLGMAEREAIRMPLRAAELERAVAGAPALGPFHSWVRVDMHTYRITPGAARLRRTVRLLDRLDQRLAAHLDGTRRLLDSPWGSPGTGSVQPLFRVPLLVADRDAAIAALARRRITTGYLYDPPLDDYASELFTDPSPDPAPARWFARHALPADPLKAEQVLAVLRAEGIHPAEGVAAGLVGPHRDGTGD